MMSLTLLGITYARPCSVFTLCQNNTVLLLSLVLHLFRSTWYDLCFYPFLLHVKNLTIHGSIDALVSPSSPGPCSVPPHIPEAAPRDSETLCFLYHDTGCFLFLMIRIIVASRDHRETWGIRYKQDFLLLNLNGLNLFSLCLVFLLDNALFQPDGINCVPQHSGSSAL